MSREESIRALRRSNPRRAAGFEESMGAYKPLRERVVATDPDFAPRRRQRPLHLRLAMVGVGAVVIAGLAVAWQLTAPVAPSGGGPRGLDNAYAAVAKAMADTAAAGKSGTIETKMRADFPARTFSTSEEAATGRAKDAPTKTAPASFVELTAVFKWHGDDMSLLVGSKDPLNDNPGMEARYVGGKFYQEWDFSEPGEAPGKPVWMQLPVNGDDKESLDDPSVWVTAARSSIEGGTMRRIISATKDLKQTPNEDGSTTFSGTTTAGEIQETLDVGALPGAARPVIKCPDPKTPVIVELSVGADGLVRGMTASYKTDDGEWRYEATYRDLGKTGAIEAPDPASVKQWDPKDGRG